MKVWQLVAALQRMPAGFDVSLQHNNKSVIVEIEKVIRERKSGGYVLLIGDGETKAAN